MTLHSFVNWVYTIYVNWIYLVYVKKVKSDNNKKVVRNLHGEDNFGIFVKKLKIECN